MRVEALKNKDIERVKTYLINHKDKRLYPMFVIGLNTGLRISDLVRLKVKDLRNSQYLVIKSEQKTEKRKEIIINRNVKNIMKVYYKDHEEYEYLFKSQKGGHICTDYAYILMKKAFKKCNIKYNTGTHTLRKTYGKKLNESHGIDIAQLALGHENQRDTLRYIGVERASIDKAIMQLNI